MVGDLLAERYSLTAHVNDDSSGRQVWRGMDVLLNRSVTVVLRTPGGAEAEEMLTAAVAASRVNHPNIVGVYDAVDQGDCAYIVREWVEGQALRDVISASQIPVEDACGIIQCVASAVAAVHASGVAHGNVHPGTILLSDDDRVVLADPRADAGATQVGDVRALGATLYCAITGGWPRTVPGPASLPDAPTDAEGMPLEPRQLREDVPERVNRLVCSLLEPSQAPPTAAELSDELDHLSFGPDTGALAIVQTGEIEAVERTLPPHLVKKRLLFGGAALAGLALLGLVIALIVIPSGNTTNGAEPGGGKQDDEKGEDLGAPKEVELELGSITLLDPSSGASGDSSAPQNLEHLVDGDPGTEWNTNEYKAPKWANLMSGMGIMLDLGEERQIQQVILDLPNNGNEVGVYAGKGSLETGKDIDVGDLDVIADKQTNETGSVTFTAAAEAPKTQYLLIWCTDPGPVDGGFQWKVNEIEVLAQ